MKEAQTGGVGVIVYNRKEGRALGEVTKFLVYNARKRQEGGDQAATYFERTECVAGVQDARFQQLMPDVLHWLGVTRIDRLMSMSNMKYDAMVHRASRSASASRFRRSSCPTMRASRSRRRRLPAISRRTRPTKDELTKTVGARSRNSEWVTRTAATRSLLSPAAVRERAHEMLRGRARMSFSISVSTQSARMRRMSLDIMRANYPSLDIPFHARWRHFTVDCAIAGRSLPSAPPSPTPSRRARRL